MKKISVSYIDSLCEKFEIIASRCIEKGFYNRAIRILRGLSYIQYKFFLGFTNSFIENTVNNLAHKLDKKLFKVNGNERSIVIVDEINADHIGLMFQYLTALISGSYKILYIYERKEHKTAERKQLMDALYSYSGAQVVSIPSNVYGISKSQWLYERICSFGSKKVLMHFGEWYVEGCIACCALPNDIVRYRINCADHCYWVGSNCADYTFEFRHYGANLTYKERGLIRNQIVYIPFYPVMTSGAFEGFPEESKNKFIFFSGGAIYKIVDDDNTFFRLCKSILDNCTNSVILFAGADVSNTILSKGIEEFGLQGRFMPIGYRKDILEVFKRCDAYINTYPFGGGLMCQYAAQCSKPILNYKDRESEECIAQKNDCSFTSFTEKEFIDEAVRLYSDNEYKNRRGAEMQHVVISKEEFNNALLTFLNKGESVYAVKWEDHFAPKDYRIEDAIAYNNKKLASFYVKLFNILGIDSIITMPWNVLSLAFYGVKRQLKKTKNL